MARLPQILLALAAALALLGFANQALGATNELRYTLDETGYADPVTILELWSASGDWIASLPHPPAGPDGIRRIAYELPYGVALTARVATAPGDTSGFGNVRPYGAACSDWDVLDDGWIGMDDFGAFRAFWQLGQVTLEDFGRFLLCYGQAT